MTEDPKSRARIMPGDFGWLPAPLDPSKWRDQVLQVGLQIAVVFGTIVYIPSVWAATVQGQMSIVVVDTFALATVIALLFMRRLQYRARASIFAVVLFVLGVWLLIEVGPISQIYLLGFSLITALLLGLRVGMVTVALNATTLLVLGIVGFTAPEMVMLGREMNLMAWVAITLNFLLVNLILVATVGAVMNALEGILVREQDARASLEHERGTLMATNAALKEEIRKRTEAEESRSELESRMAATLESMTDAFYMLDTEWRFTYINREAERILNRPREELLGKKAHEVYPQYAKNAVGNSYRASMRDQVALLFEEYDEELGIWYELRIFPSERGLAVYFRDVTERRNADSALRDSEHRFRTVFNQQFQFMAILCADGRVLEMNELPFQVAGLDRESVTGKLFWELPSWDGLPTMQAEWPRRLERAASTNQPVLTVDEYRTADGEVRIANAATTAVRNAEGALQWFIVQATDITEQRRSEELARQTQALLEIAGRISRLGGWAVELPSLQLIWSDQLRAIHEVPPDYMPTVEEALDFYAPESREGVLQAFQACVSEGKPYDLEFELITAKGRRIWVRSIAQVERDEQGIISRIQGAFQDITEQRNAELERIRLETQLTTTLESITDAFFTVDKEWRFTFLNREAERLMQRTRVELLGRILWEEFPEAVGTASEVEYHRAVEQQTPVEFSQNYAPLRAWFEVRAYPTEEGLAVYFRDVTAQQQASEELRVATDLLERTFESLDVAVLLVEVPSRKIIRCNAAAEGVFGYDTAEMLGQDTRIIHVNEEKFRKFGDDSSEALDRGEVYRTDYQLRRKDGTIIDTQHTVSALRREDGEIIGVVSVMRDVTNEKRAVRERESLEEQFRQSQKMEAVGRLAGGVAHDFNNMLSVILGHAELMEATPDLPAELQDDLREIIAAGQRSSDLTRQLLAFARKQTIAPEILDINTTISSMLRMLTRLLGEDVELVWKPGEAVDSVRMDPAQIDQILVNLVVNARDAVSSGGRIVIETRSVDLDEEYCEVNLGCEPGPYVMLMVSDNGCGMDENTKKNLFEPFFTTKPAGKGTGLGLPTVYGIVQQNHGAIHVYSEEGQGSIFSIYLPSHEASSEVRATVPAAAPHAGNLETILLVEDEPPLLRLGERMLTSMGYTVLAAGRPEDALELAKTHDKAIHLLITDVVMPGMNGLDVWDHLKAEQPNLKCLFMSGYTADIIARHGVLDDELHFIHKPFTRDALGVKIRETLGTPDPV